MKKTKLRIKDKWSIIALNILGFLCIAGGSIYIVIDRFYIRQNWKISLGFTAIIVIYISVYVIQKVLKKKKEQRAQAKETASALGKYVRNFNVPINTIIHGFLTTYPLAVSALVVGLSEKYIGTLKWTLWTLFGCVIIGFMFFAFADYLEQKSLYKLEVEENNKRDNAIADKVAERLRG